MRISVGEDGIVDIEEWIFFFNRISWKLLYQNFVLSRRKNEEERIHGKMGKVTWASRDSHYRARGKECREGDTNALSLFFPLTPKPQSVFVSRGEKKLSHCTRLYRHNPIRLSILTSILYPPLVERIILVKHTEARFTTTFLFHFPSSIVCRPGRDRRERCQRTLESSTSSSFLEILPDWCGIGKRRNLGWNAQISSLPSPLCLLSLVYVCVCVCVSSSSTSHKSSSTQLQIVPIKIRIKIIPIPSSRVVYNYGLSLTPEKYEKVEKIVLCESLEREIFFFFFFFFRTQLWQ